MTTDNPIIYLDNAATTFPKPEVVYQAMDHFYRNFGGNAGRGSNPLARKASALIDETRSLLKLWLDALEVVFQPSATMALNTVIQGAGLRAGDIVYVSPFEHNSVLRPLEYLRKNTGIEIHVLPYDSQTFECKLDRIHSLFQLDPPAMVCITQISNVFGVLSPVDDLTLLAKSSTPSAITLVDGAQAAGLRPIDMSQVDALVFSGHKSLFGPYGIAGIAFGGTWRPSPLIYGGTGTQSESIDMPQNGLSRYEAGSQNISAMAGLNAALHWLQQIGRNTVNAHIDRLMEELLQELAKLTSVHVFIPKHHSSIVSFNIERVSPQAVETALGAQQIIVRAGLHCAPWSHEFTRTTQIGGTVRISGGFWNTSEDIHCLLKNISMLLD